MRRNNDTVPDCAWCGAECDQPRPYANWRGELFCSPSHRSSSNRALARLTGEGAPKKRKNAGYSRSTRPQVTCPKCYGAKRFSPYAHIAEGICFTCGGAGTVDATKERGGTITTPTPVAHKTVTLPGFGPVTITRSAGSRGSFRADFPYDSDAYGGVVYFNVRDGRVVDADTDNFSPSYKGQKAEIVAGLQAALKPRQNPRRNGAERVTVPGMGTGVVVAHRPGGMCDIRLSGGQVVRKPKSTLKPA